MMPKVKGSHPWALVLCNASDLNVPAWPGLDYFNTLIASPGGSGLDTWWQQVSGGNIDLAGSKVFGWYTLPNTLAEIVKMKRPQLIPAARTAATAAGADLSGYRHLLAIVTGATDIGQSGDDVALDIRATNGQPGWRWCANCAGIAYWDGSTNPGFCIAGGRHDHNGSSYYSLPHDTSFRDGQSGWRWCNKCDTLNFNTAVPAPCPAGGTHTLASSADYVLRESGTAANEQQNWRWCSKCQSLAFYDGSDQPGPCSVGGRHDHSGSSNYSIPFGWAANLGFLAHETGHAFGLDHAFGTSRVGDFTSDHRPGAYGDWTDIMSWDGTAHYAAPLFTPAGAGVSMPTLYKLGWLSGSEVATIVAPAPAQSFTLRPAYGGIAGSAPRMIRVIEAAQGWIYTAEFRAPLSWDQGVQTPRVVIHAMRTLYQAGQDGWRHCANCEGLIYAGQTACPAGGVHDGSQSSDYWISINAGSSAGQIDWRWCDKCCGLFYAGSAALGACPAGGNHDGSQSAGYAIPFSGAGQSSWKWCNKCQGLAYAGSSTLGVCPAGGLHNHAGSGNYTLHTSTGPNRQNKWRWCNKCQGLYYAGLGACQGHDVHRFGADDYAPVHDLTGASGQGWRYCRKCYAMAFNDGTPPPGACAAGGLHDHSTSGKYAIPRDAEAEAGRRQWHLCGKCSALNLVATNGSPGLCSAGGNHQNPVDEYMVAHDTVHVPGAHGFHWCRKCDNMVIGNNPAFCVAGGSHDTFFSANYVVRTDPGPIMREAAYWRTCTKCSTLFALNTPDGSDEKPCAGSGKHSATGEYFLTSVTGDPFWRLCSKCESLAFWDGSRSPGPCPAGGPHDHSASNCYIPPWFRYDVTQVVNDNLVLGGSWRDPSHSVRFEVLSMDASHAFVRVTATSSGVGVGPVAG